MINALYKVIFLFQGGEIMIAMFFAQRVILEKTAFKDVPNALKPAVKEALEDSGLGFLSVEE